MLLFLKTIFSLFFALQFFTAAQSATAQNYSVIPGVVADDPEVAAILARNTIFEVSGGQARLLYSGAESELALQFFNGTLGQSSQFQGSATEYQKLAKAETRIARKVRLTAAQMIVRAEDLEDCDASGMSESVCEGHRENLAVSSMALSDEAAKHEKSAETATRKAAEAGEKKEELADEAPEAGNEVAEKKGGCENGLSGPERGFLWKPVSEKDGKLVVLTPSNMATGDLALKDFNGNLIERGKFQCRTNGYRATYRFAKPGAAYQGPLVVEVNGKSWKIFNTAARIE